MEENLKQLLLKDLCARSPYGIKVEVYLKDKDIKSVDCVKYDTVGTYIRLIENENFSIKPYLRPMSSMTAEEKIELCVICYLPDEAKTIDEKMYVLKINMDGYDWLNSHHFDYRGLIEKGLAIEATEGMYNNKTE